MTRWYQLSDRVRHLARFNYALFWKLPLPFERLTPEIQAKHLALAEEVLNFMRVNGWLREEQQP